jgi:hypothetical protein
LWRSAAVERERYGETLRALLLAPAPRAATSASCWGCSRCRPAEVLLVPMVAPCSGATVQPAAAARRLARQRTIGLRGGHAVRGDAGARALPMLPILLYPIIIPVIIAGVRGTAALLGAPRGEATAIMRIGIPAASTWYS